MGLCLTIGQIGGINKTTRYDKITCMPNKILQMRWYLVNLLYTDGHYSGHLANLTF